MGVAVILTGGAIVNSQNSSPVILSSPTTPSRTPAEEVQAQSEYLAYKKVCEQKPDDKLRQCAKAIFNEKRHKDCAKMRKDWDDKWSPGRHESDIAAALRAAEKAAVEIKKSCLSNWQSDFLL